MQGKDNLLHAFTEREKCSRAEEDLESWNEREVGEEEKRGLEDESFNDTC
jgi:hypothetical protein